MNPPYIAYKLHTDGTIVSIPAEKLKNSFININIIAVYFYHQKRLYIWIGERVSRDLQNKVPMIEGQILERNPDITILRHFTVEGLRLETMDFLQFLKISQDEFQSHIDEWDQFEAEILENIEKRKIEVSQYLAKKQFDEALIETRKIIEYADKIKNVALIEEYEEIVKNINRTNISEKEKNISEKCSQLQTSYEKFYQENAFLEAKHVLEEILRILEESDDSSLIRFWKNSQVKLKQQEEIFNAQEAKRQKQVAENKLNADYEQLVEIIKKNELDEDWGSGITSAKEILKIVKKLEKFEEIKTWNQKISQFEDNISKKKENIIESEKKAREEAEQKAREEAEQKAREEAEQKAREEAEQKAREEAEQKAREEAEQKAREEAEQKAREEAEQKAWEEAEQKAREEAEQKAWEEAEQKAREEAEQKAREEAEQKAWEEAEQKAREEAEQKAREEAEQKAREEAEQKAREEAEQKAREEAEQKAREEAEQKAREEAEQKAREEAEQKAREEAEQKAWEEAEQKAREEAEQKAREEAEQKAREEAEQKAREEAEQKAREEAEQKAREEAEQKAREEAEQKAREEAEQKAREEAEQKAREEAEQKAREEAEQKAREEAEQKAREEAEQKAREEAEQKAREEAEQKAREEAEQKAREEAEQLRQEREKQLKEVKKKLRAHEKAGEWPFAIAECKKLVILLKQLELEDQHIKFFEKLQKLEIKEEEWKQEVKTQYKSRPKEFDDIDISTFKEEELDVKNYLEFLREANTSEARRPFKAYDLLLRCLAIIKKSPEKFLESYPKRKNDRITLEKRLHSVGAKVEDIT
ncbi:hypothetical protein WKT22_03073 [Candidatus Lokiarchaeum ossiferum]|uniref:hypothetical protein n=1 Tax=Candidatus Lokiarchaeum ossiferum TaxID=2951803 RepID=UPI003A6334D4